MSNKYKVVGAGSVYVNLVIAASATQIKKGSADLDGRHGLLIHNPAGSGREIYIGNDTNVTTANGIPIAEGMEREIALDPDNPVSIYGIASQNTTVRIWELSS